MASGNWNDSKPLMKGFPFDVISSSTSMVEPMSTPGKLATRVFPPV